VVLPLLKQNKERSEESAQLKEEVSKVTKNLKMLHSVVRTPILCDLFHKMERKKLKKEEIEKANVRAGL